VYVRVRFLVVAPICLVLVNKSRRLRTWNHSTLGILDDANGKEAGDGGGDCCFLKGRIRQGTFSSPAPRASQAFLPPSAFEAHPRWSSGK
jgi:hypothetical protein